LRNVVRVSLLRAGVIALAALPFACGKGSAEPASILPIAAVEVPAPSAAADGARADETVPARRPVRAGDSEPTEVEVVAEGDSVHVSSRPDAGIRFWGTFTSMDGGFSFKGGFSATGTSGGLDGGTAP
jgi:hypothetical protein